MANKIQIKRGILSQLPVLSDGELALCKDVNQMYIGNSGNKEIVMKDSNVFTELVSKTDDNSNKIKDLMYSVKNSGAKGDGVTDDTQSILSAFNYCVDNSKVLFFPNGTYIFNGTLKYSEDNETDIKKDTPINIVGESKLGVFLNRNDSLTNDVINLGGSNEVYIENIASQNAKIKLYPPFDTMREYVFKARHRNVYATNIIMDSTEIGGTSWLSKINTPKPSSYTRDFKDSRYSTYPLEITNNSGYNAININNVNLNEDDTIANPADNSAIGITDVSEGVAGVIYIDMYGNRRFFKLCRKASEVTSGVNADGIVMDIGYDGQIGIGCSFLNNDPNAPGSGLIKGRGKNPAIQLYDSLNENMNSRIISVNKEFRIYHNAREVVTADENGNIITLGTINTGVSKGLDLKNTTDKFRYYLDTQGRLIKGVIQSNGSVTDGNVSNKVMLENLNGATSQRPTGLTWGYVGLMYFDQTLNKPIWWAGDKWVDAVGTTV